MVRRSRKNKKESKEFNIPWYVWGIGILLLAGVVFWLVFSTLGTFVYHGLAFSVEKLGNNLVVYHYVYTFKDSEGQLSRYNVYLREDPRKNTVPVLGEISYPQHLIRLSIDSTNLQKCEDGSIAISELSAFLKNNEFEIKVGSPDLDKANQANVSVVDCETHPRDSVILVTESNQTAIIKNDMCYRIEVNNCEILPGVEKFIVQSLIDAKARKLRLPS